MSAYAGSMSKEHIQRHQNKGPIRRRDLTELVTRQIIANIEEVRVQIIEKIQDVTDLVEIIARQVVRDIEEKE